MKNKYFLITFLLWFILIRGYGQADKTISQHILFSIGQGYDDGATSITKLPTFGVAYERNISRYFSFGLKVWYYYRTFPDSYLLSDGLGRPVLDIMIKGAYGPFVTDNEIEKISNIGIKYLDPENIIKELSIPVIFTFGFYPLNFHKNKLGLVVGLGAGYNSYNWWRDYFPVKKLVLNDGTEFTELYLSQNTEFRNIMIQDYYSIVYSYSLKKMDIGIYASEYSRYIGGYNHNFELSLFAKFKI